jgi:hypothetical protein
MLTVQYVRHTYEFAHNTVPRIEEYFIRRGHLFNMSLVNDSDPVRNFFSAEKVVDDKDGRHLEFSEEAIPIHFSGIWPSVRRGSTSVHQGVVSFGKGYRTRDGNSLPLTAA